jgi:hypothetical protein
MEPCVVVVKEVLEGGAGAFVLLHQLGGTGAVPHEVY